MNILTTLIEGLFFLVPALLIVRSVSRDLLAIQTLKRQHMRDDGPPPADESEPLAHRLVRRYQWLCLKPVLIALTFLVVYALTSPWFVASRLGAESTLGQRKASVPTTYPEPPPRQRLDTLHSGEQTVRERQGWSAPEAVIDQTRQVRAATLEAIPERQAP